MSALARTRSPILSALARSRVQSPVLRQARHISSATRAAPDWGSQWKRAGSCALMYFPTVAVVMFWPYIVEPIMDLHIIGKH